MSAGPASRTSSSTPPAPDALRARVSRLQGAREEGRQVLASRKAELERLGAYLSLAPRVEQALEALGEAMFSQLTQVIETHLTWALQDVLEQPIALKTDRSSGAHGATIDFYIERDGQQEDILKGQGGSVANVLSVGLRMLALTTLDPDRHRRFLVLDEQDCWLRPDLVPRLVKMVHDAGQALGFQTLMISHHDVSFFRDYADKIYRLLPDPEGVRVVELDASEEEERLRRKAAPKEDDP